MNWFRSSTRDNSGSRERSTEPGLHIAANTQTPGVTDHRAARTEQLIAFTVFFILILALKFNVLDQPPVWDGAMGVFPAANTLADHNFDLRYLLEQPGFRSAGPNVHSLSPITWLTAGVIKLIGPTSALLPVLHLLHFALAAATMAGLYRLARPLGVRLAALMSVTALAVPLVLTQAGYLYLEFPILATTVFAALAWVRQDRPKALLWSTLAVLIKGSGIIVPFALAGLAFLDPRPHRRDPRSGVLLVVVPAAVLALTLAVAREFAPGAGETWYQGYLTLMFLYLVRIPDILFLLVVYFLAMIVVRPWRKGTSSNGTDDEESTALLIAAALNVTFFCFYLAVPLVKGAVVVNPRYYVQIVPFALFGIVAAARRRYTERAIVVVLLLAIGWFAANRNGEFYPDNSLNNFGLIERSGAYRDLLALQLAEMRAMEDLPDTVPVYYDQSTHLRFEYPLMGYAEGPLANGRYVLHDEQVMEGRLEDFPDEFFMMYQYPWMGGEIFRSILQQAEEDPAVEVSITEITSAQFRSQLVRVSKTEDAGA